MTCELALGSCGWGTTIDADRVFALLDHFAENGGTIVDTADNYSFWDEGATGREAEDLIGRWLASRRPKGLTIATKLGAQPMGPASAWPANREGLSAKAIKAAVEGSLTRLGVERLDVLYIHVEDRTVALEETMGALHEEVTAGRVGLLGVSNHAVWRVERAQNIARANGWTPFTWLQYRHSYLQRTRPPGLLGDRPHNDADPALIDYVRCHPGSRLFAYSPMVGGAFAGRELPGPYRGIDAEGRLRVLAEVAREVDATPNQVVLSWLMGGDPPSVPVIGSSRVASLAENLAARDLVLTVGQRERLDTLTA